MISHRRTALALLVAIPVLLAFPGFLVPAAGAGFGAGATGYFSAAREEIDADPRQVVDVALSVLEEMDIEVESRQGSALDGRVVERTARDERVEIKVGSPAKGRTAIDVRVGILDDDAAKRILDRILARL